MQHKDFYIIEMTSKCQLCFMPNSSAYRGTALSGEKIRDDGTPILEELRLPKFLSQQFAFVVVSIDHLSKTEFKGGEYEVNDDPRAQKQRHLIPPAPHSPATF